LGYSSRIPPAGPGRVRAAILSLVLGGAAAFAVHSALDRLDLGPDAQVVRASNASLSAQDARLDTAQSDLAAALEERPPALPPIPDYPPVVIPRIPAPQVVRVVYADVQVQQGKKGKKYEKQREAEKKRREQQREAEQKRREERREAEKKRREEQKKH